MSLRNDSNKVIIYYRKGRLRESDVQAHPPPVTSTAKMATEAAALAFLLVAVFTDVNCLGI